MAGKEAGVKPRKPLPRSTKPIARTPLKRSVIPIVRQRAKLRRGPLKDPGYVEFLHGLNCVACDRKPPTQAQASDWHALFGDAIVGAHTANNGMRSKGPDSSRVPLCPGHHGLYDSGRKAFEAEYAIDMKAEAAIHFLAYALGKKAG